MDKLAWLVLFTGGYWSYCIYWGIRGARQASTASDYFIAGRTIGLWVFVLAATATSFSGWTFVGHPGTIFNVGLPYAFASFYAITIPFTGVMFLKRQWLLGRRYGYITPGEMFADYYKTDSMRLLTALVAMIANKSPKPFPWQQVFASSLVIGGILFVFTAIQGLSGSVLFHEILPDTEKLGLPTNSEGQPITDYLVPYLIASLEQDYPWLLALLCVCALAAMQSTGAAYMSTASGIITRDIFRHFFRSNASQATQILVGRLTVFIIVAMALMVGLASGDLLVLLGGAAVSYGLQMWPALLGICYFRWFTPKGVVAGLMAGIVAVTFTYVTQLGGLIGIGRYPLTIHSAGWGILFNLGTCILVSSFTQARHTDGARHREESHDFLRQHTSLEPATRRWKKPVWALTAIWFLFAIGPFAVLGNESDPAAWSFGIPTLWIWQVAWWIVGVIMMYLLAFKLEMSTEPRSEVRALVEPD